MCPVLTNGDVTPVLGELRYSWRTDILCSVSSDRAQVITSMSGPTAEPDVPCGPLVGWPIGSPSNGCVTYPSSYGIVSAWVAEPARMRLFVRNPGMTRGQAADLVATAAHRRRAADPECHGC